MGGQYIFHILYSNLFSGIMHHGRSSEYGVNSHLRHPRFLSSDSGFSAYTMHEEYYKHGRNRHGFRTHLLDSVHHPRKIQVIFADKFFQVSRTHVFQIRIFLTCALIFFLIPQCLFQVKFINSKLIWHYYICLIRNLSCHPVMTADSLQPPDFVLILESNSIHLIGSVFLHMLQGGLSLQRAP